MTAFPKDTLVLGRIEKINLYDLSVSLPFGLRGVVKINEIGEDYHNRLKNYVDSGVIDKDLKPLSDLFSVGDIVRCYVLAVHSEGKKRSAYQLSLNPSLVNQRIPNHRLKKRMSLVAAVTSIEDHGWILDAGITNLTLFLAQKEAPVLSEDRELQIGSLVTVKLLKDAEALAVATSSTGVPKILQVTAREKRLQDCVLAETVPILFDCIIPGMWLRTTLRKPPARLRTTSAGRADSATLPSTAGEAGALARFQEYRVEVPRGHVASSVFSVDNAEPVSTLCILHADPTGKRLVASSLAHLLPERETWSDFQRGVDHVGDKLKDARVTAVAKRHLMLWLPEPYNLRAIVRREEVADAPNNDVAQVATKRKKKKRKHDEMSKSGGSERFGRPLADCFAREDVLTCRIMGFDLMENFAIASLKQSVLEAPYLSLSDLSPGDKVRAEFLRMVKEGLVVTLGCSRLHGLIPFMHLSDYSFSKEHRERLLAQGRGAPLRCRVLEVNPKESKLILTAKPALVRSKERPLCRADQLIGGALGDGFVVKTAVSGILVCLYGGLRGWVRRAELGIGPEEVLEQAFFVGQVVRCRVLHYDPDDQRRPLQLSLLLEGRKTIGEQRKRKLDENSAAADIKAGLICSAQVLKRVSMGLSVRLRDDVEAFLSTVHLSDVAEHRVQLQKAARKGQIIHEVVVIERNSGISVSAKRSYIEAARKLVSDTAPDSPTISAKFIREFSEVQLGDVLLGSVNHAESYGLFVSLTAGVRGLVPNKFITNQQVSCHPNKLFQPGDTVVGKVVELREDKQRCLFSLRLTDTFHAPSDLPVAMADLEHNISERLQLAETAPMSVRELRVSQVVDVVVRRVDDAAVYCRLPGTKETEAVAVCAMANTQDVANLERGRKLKAVVLDTPAVAIGEDPVQVWVCVSARVVRCVQDRVENKFTRIRQGQVIRADVLHVCAAGWAVVHLSDHAAGRLAVLPLRRHHNDAAALLPGFGAVSVGQRHLVVLKREIASAGVWLAYLKTHEPLGHVISQGSSVKASGDASGTQPRKLMNVSIGDKLKVAVTEVLDFQLNVAVGGRRGRVFVSELADEFEAGCKPCADYRVDQEVEVRVVGFRENLRKEKEKEREEERPLKTSRRSLPYLECSMKDSVMKQANEQLSTQVKLVNGESVWVFLKHPQVLKPGRFVSPKTRVYLNLDGSNGGPCFCRLLNFSDQLEVLRALVGQQSGRSGAPAPYSQPGTAVKARVVCAESREVSCVVDKTKTENDNDWLLGMVSGSRRGAELLVHLSGGVDGRLHALQVQRPLPMELSELSELYPSGKLLACRLLDADTMRLSLREEEKEDADTDMMGYVLRHGEDRVEISVLNRAGEVVTAQVPLDSEARRSVARKLFPTGRLVRCRPSDTTADADSKQYVLHFSGQDSAEFESKVAKLEEELPAKKAKRERSSSSCSQGDGAEADDAAAVVEEDGEDEDDGLVSLPKIVFSSDMPQSVLKPKLPTLTLSTKTFDDIDDDDDEEQGAGVTAKKRRSTKGGGQEEEEEEAAYTSRADFELKVTRESGVARHWIDYMYFHINKERIDDARAVCERGLQSISSFQSDYDKQRSSLLIARMRLEARFGTPDELSAAIARALHQESRAVFTAALELLRHRGLPENSTAGESAPGQKKKQQEGLNPVRVASRFRKAMPMEPAAWVATMEAHFDNCRFEEARRLLFVEGLKTLPKKNHVPVLIRLAELEYGHAEAARGQKIFEQLLSTYSKRADVYLSYCKCLKEAEMSTEASELLLRCEAANVSSDCVQKMRKLLGVQTQDADGADADGTEDDSDEEEEEMEM